MIINIKMVVYLKIDLLLNILVISLAENKVLMFAFELFLKHDNSHLSCILQTHMYLGGKK